MDYLEYLQDQISRGIWSFSAKEMAATLGLSPKDKLATLRKKGRIISPARGFYVIVPEEYIHSKRLPVDRYIDALMDYYSLPYYVGLLTAAYYHGSAHQSPQSFGVVTTRDRRNIQLGRNLIVFYRKIMTKTIPIVKRKTATGYFNLSTPEATFFDLVQFNRHLGGLSQVGLVLADMLERISPQSLISAA